MLHPLDQYDPRYRLSNLLNPVGHILDPYNKHHRTSLHCTLCRHSRIYQDLVSDHQFAGSYDAVAVGPAVQQLEARLLAQQNPLSRKTGEQGVERQLQPGSAAGSVRLECADDRPRQIRSGLAGALEEPSGRVDG